MVKVIENLDRVSLALSEGSDQDLIVRSNSNKAQHDGFMVQSEFSAMPFGQRVGLDPDDFFFFLTGMKLTRLFPYLGGYPGAELAARCEDHLEQPECGISPVKEDKVCRPEIEQVFRGHLTFSDSQWLDQSMDRDLVQDIKHL